MCMTEKDFLSDVAFAFLENISEKFLSMCTMEEIQNATSLSLTNKMTSCLKNEMEIFNNKEVTNVINKLKESLIETKNEILEVNDILNERKGKLKLIVKNAEDLETSASTYYSASKAVKRNMIKRRIKFTLFIIIFIVVLVGILLKIFI